MFQALRPWGRRLVLLSALLLLLWRFSSFSLRLLQRRQRLSRLSRRSSLRLRPRPMSGRTVPHTALGAEGLNLLRLSQTSNQNVCNATAMKDQRRPILASFDQSFLSPLPFSYQCCPSPETPCRDQAHTNQTASSLLPLYSYAFPLCPYARVFLTL